MYDHVNLISNASERADLGRAIQANKTSHNESTVAQRQHM